MKKVFFPVFLIFIQLSIFSQGNIDFKIIVQDNYGKAMANMDITALERSTFVKKTAKTDQNGIAEMKLYNGKDWILSVGEMKKCMSFSALDNKAVDLQKDFIYDLNLYHRKKKQDKNRDNKGFEIIEQTCEEDTHFDPGDCMLIVRLSNIKGNALFGQKIDIVSTQDSIIYRAKTNEEGKAFFIVPNETAYDIDINELKNYNYHDFKDEYVRHLMDLQFEPTKVDETVKNDTIYQKVTLNDKPSTERALVAINVSGGSNYGRNENVFLRELKSGKIYAAKTDASGTARFLIPNGHIYMVDFEYQKDADGINLSETIEITSETYNVTYKPDPGLQYPEKFIPTPDNLIVPDIESFITKQFQKPKDEPLLVKIFSAKRINKKSKEALFVLTFSGADSYGGQFRIPLNISLVMDKSGSMYSQNRSESLKKALWVIGNSIKKGDMVSFVLFDSGAITAKHIDDNHMKEIQEIIENYIPGGGTSIYSGLHKGVDDIKKNFNKDYANKIILLTDGYGSTPPKAITDFVAKEFAGGIEFSTIGLGNSYNQSLLELIAREGHGSFKHVNKPDKLTEAFLNEVEMSFGYLVKDLKIEIYHDEELIFKNLLGYPVRTKTDDLIEFEISKLPYGANQIAFLKFKLKKPDPKLENKPLKMKVSYFDPITKKEITKEETVSLEWTEETETEWLIEKQEQMLYAVATMNQTLKTMAEAYAAGNNEEAKQHLIEGKDQINEIYPDIKPKEVKKLFDEIDKYLKLLYQIDKNK